MVAKKSKSAEDKEENFTTILKELEKVVSSLETGAGGLESALESYEKGVGLARKGHEMLNKAEKKVEVLLSAENGDIKTEALDP